MYGWSCNLLDVIARPSNISLQRVLLATTQRLLITNSNVATIKYHMHYPICTGGAVISLTSLPGRFSYERPGYEAKIRIFILTINFVVFVDE